MSLIRLARLTTAMPNKSSTSSLRVKSFTSKATAAAAATTALLSYFHLHNSGNIISHSHFTVSAFNMNMSASSSSTSTMTRPRHPLTNLSDNFDHSWVSQLSSESQENRKKSKVKTPQDDGISNNVRRPVYNGHYVPVKPDPLKNPRLVIHSPDMAKELNLSPDDVNSHEFVKYFSGDIHGAFANLKTKNDDDNMQNLQPNNIHQEAQLSLT